MAVSEPVCVVQFSDTHFVEPGAEPEGGAAYDTAEAWHAVATRFAGSDYEADLAVVTGDVADHGRAGQYTTAAEAFSSLGLPVNVCAGNHDNADLLVANVARPNVATSRVIRIGDWMFLFVDSCAGLGRVEANGRMVAAAGEPRLHSNGCLGEAEAAWLSEMCSVADGAHVFVWVHHPPGVPVALSYDADYAGQWRTLLADLPMIRGLGAGHSHVPDTYEFEGRPVFVAPSLKNNFSLDPQHWLPPGYRTYEFHSSGQVTSEAHFVDDERWPRRPFGRALRSLFDGEITYEQLAEIAAARRLR